MNANLLGTLGVTNVGGRFVTGLSPGAAGSLGDDGSVMMISGLRGGEPVDPAKQQAIADRAARLMQARAQSGDRIEVPATTILQMNVTIGTVTLPFWGWLLLAAALGGGLTWAALTRGK
jgi:hypothetical protein